MEVSMIPEFFVGVRRSGGLHAEVAVTLLEYAGFDETKVKVITGARTRAYRK